MALTLNRCNILAQIDAPSTEAIGLATVRDGLVLSASLTMTAGTGASEVNQTYSRESTLADAASETLDLYGIITDSTRNVVNFARIKAIMIQNMGTVAALTVGGAASNAWTGPWASTISVRPGGFVLFAATDATAWPVVQSTTDQLKILNAGGGSSTYKLLIVGTR